MAIHEKQQKGLVFEDRNGVELPMIDEDAPNAGAGATGVDIGNIANHPYLKNKPYRELTNYDDDDDDDDGLVPAQDGPFFYTCSHLIAFQNCALLFSTNFQFIFILKNS